MAKSRLLKTYESFMLNRKFKYEEEIIDTLLSIIRENLEFLTETQNLPQLAKLGYMFNTLYYAGRVCWDSDGILLDPAIKKSIKEYSWEDDDEENNPYQFTSCGDNPKDKIEDFDSDLLYDAWGMHVKDGDEGYPTFEDFSKLIKEGKPLTELEKKELKLNKTFEDWVEIKTDPTYRYKSLYPNKKSVANHLLCTIGSGYGFNSEGYVIEEASGADQDKAMYGDWQNAKFTGEIESEINRILSIPELKETLQAAHEHIGAILKKKREKENSWKSKLKSLGGGDSDMSDEELDEIMNAVLAKKYGKEAASNKKPYSQYYPISSSSKIFIIGSKESQKREGILKIHPSYIQASIEICKDIMENSEQEKKNNVEFAKEFLGNMKVPGYKGFATKEEFNKYEMLEHIKELFSDFTDEFGEEIKMNDPIEKNTWKIYINDTATNSYADNNYYMVIGFDNNLPKGVSKSIDFLKGQSFYTNLKNSLERIKTIPEIKLVTFDYSNLFGKATANLGFYVKGYKHKIEEETSDNDFIKQGFEVGTGHIILDIKGLKALLRKPKPLGSSHPGNSTGKEYFSNALELIFTNSDFTKEIIKFRIDERQFNTIQCTHKPKEGVSLKLYDWVLKEFEEMKKSDPGYGFGKKEGSKCLYTHDFLLWLKKHEGDLK